MPLFRDSTAIRLLTIVSAVAFSATPVYAQTDDDIEARLERLEDRVGITPGGGGAYLRDNNIELRMLGYVQGQANVFDGALDRDSTNDFSVRRARLDFLVDLYDDYQLFVELDGAPGRTALVEARMDMALAGEALKLRAGKFTSQFSTENARSSRSIDTVERYLALNSLFLLPALDTQFGVMAHGRAERFNWSLGLYNGNGSANANVRDNNDAKEVQAKIGYQWTDSFSTRLALDYADEEVQTLSLVDAGFNTFASVDIDGTREGIGGDLHWEGGDWSLRAEAMGFRFDAVAENEVALYGGFVQPAWFISGNDQQGTQLLVRLETSQLDARTNTDTDALHAATLGVNWFVNPNVRLQVNGIATHVDGPSASQGFSDSRTLPSLLTQLQFKF